MPGFKRSLSAFEAFVISLAIIAPTLAMAFNVPLAVQAAGQAAPLAFLIGGAGMALIGLSFVAFSRDIASAGSAYSYVEAVFGRRFGFLAGWGLLLAYLAFFISANGLVGGFIAVGLAHLGIDLPGLWQAIALAAGIAVIFLGGREIHTLTTLMLIVEALALIAIVVLAVVILTSVPLTAAPFVPDGERGWSGIGYGMVFAVLSFAGFEGAATVAEETHDPHRAIPLAILGSLVTATLLYVLICYAQVVGYGPDGVDALGQAQAPLDTLSARYISTSYGIFLDVAAGISSFACALGSAAAAARILYTLGRGGLGARLGAIDETHGVPRTALRVAGLVNLGALALFGTWVGSRGYSEAAATIATLVLIPVYMAVGLAQAVRAARLGRWLWSGIGIAGAVLLAWPLANSLYPVPPFPGTLWPFVVLAWMAVGIALVLTRRTLMRDASA